MNVKHAVKGCMSQRGTVEHEKMVFGTDIAVQVEEVQSTAAGNTVTQKINKNALTC
jgi:hypothetical protein